MCYHFKNVAVIGIGVGWSQEEGSGVRQSKKMEKIGGHARQWEREERKGKACWI